VDFDLTESAEITLIFADGFNNNGSTANAVAVDWRIYAESYGVPFSHPEAGGGDNPIWSYTAVVTDTGVSVAGEDIVLDLVAAGENLVLPPGRYWLSVFPTFDNNVSSSADQRWAWFQAAQQLGEAHLVSPVLFSLPNWASYSSIGITTISDAAFRIEGNIVEGPEGCVEPGDVPWLSVSHQRYHGPR
jgi:hypothetical protein